MPNPLNNKIFQDATKARQWLEALLWPDGPACGYCGVIDDSTPLGKRPGFYQCNSCRKQFTVMVGTVFERSHIPLNKWLTAAFLICASKKGISAHQMHRMLDITYKSAWFMMHRLREAMKQDTSTPLGGMGKIVEADETFIGRKKGVASGGGPWHKMAVLTLIERGGPSRSIKIDKINKRTIRAILLDQVDPMSRLMTDEANHYQMAPVNQHDSVNHQKEYVSGDVYTNTAEGFFSIFKRGMRGVYQHCSEQHLNRYLAEFDFRYSNREALGVNDNARAHKALLGIRGKRLTYRRTVRAEETQA
jgi:transposase-like protein